MEVLKQKNNAPVEVAHQVCIFYAATKGYLETVAVEDVRDYEAGLYPYLDENCFSVLEEIRTTGKLSQAAEEALQDGLKAYGQEFASTR